MHIPFPACCGASVVTSLEVYLKREQKPMLISGLPLKDFEEVDKGVYVKDTGKYKNIDVSIYQSYPKHDFYEKVKAMAIEAGVFK